MAVYAVSLCAAAVTAEYKQMGSPESTRERAEGRTRYPACHARSQVQGPAFLPCRCCLRRLCCCSAPAESVTDPPHSPTASDRLPRPAGFMTGMRILHVPIDKLGSQSDPDLPQQGMHHEICMQHGNFWSRICVHPVPLA